MRAWTYRSSSSSATPTLSRCASRTRSSRPTSAVNDTLFGAENVASHPARCSIVPTFSPRLFMYSLAAWRRISCSPVIGCCPSESRWNALREPRRVVPTVRRAFRATPRESGLLRCSSSPLRWRTLPRDTTVPDLRSEVWRWSACVGLLEKVSLPARWLSLDFLVLTLLLFIRHEFLPRFSIPRRLACSCSDHRNLRRFLRWPLRRSLDILR